MTADQSEFTYNLPGLGTVRPRLFPSAAAVWDFLKPYGHVRRLQTTSQLGVLREAFPGAHHTRYEYVVAQLALLSGLAQGDAITAYPLSAPRNELGTLPGISAPSGAELLQVLAILTNAGHVQTTFAGSRVLLHHFRETRPPRRAFRRGLPEEDRPEFDRVVDEYRLYRLHYLLMSFLLERYRGREHGDDYASFCQALLREFMKEESESESMRSLFQLYQGIRLLTFLALDSLYAPVPFSLDLGPVFLGPGREVDEIFGPRSHFQEALQRFAGVMQDSVYLSGEALLHLSVSSQRVRRALDAVGEEGKPITGVRELWRLLAPKVVARGPADVQSEVFAYQPGQNERDWSDDRMVKLEYNVNPEDASTLLPDAVAWETRARSRVGKRSARFGAEWAPRHDALRVVGAISTAEDQSVLAARGIAAQLVKLDQRARVEVHAYEPGAQKNNGLRIAEFLVRSVLGWENMYRFRAPRISRPSPVIALQGSTKAADCISKYRESVQQQKLLDADELHEYDVVERVLREISYRGLLLAYVGSTVVVDTDSHEEIAEFDAMVFLLSGDPDPGKVLVVEAKNVPNGNTRAKAQLRKRLPELGYDKGQFDLMDIGTDGAYASLTLE